jgi:hypothetical protein
VAGALSRIGIDRERPAGSVASRNQEAYRDAIHCGLIVERDFAK